MLLVPTLVLIYVIPTYKKLQIDAESDQWDAIGLDFEPLLAVQFSQRKAGNVLNAVVSLQIPKFAGAEKVFALTRSLTS